MDSVDNEVSEGELFGYLDQFRSDVKEKLYRNFTSFLKFTVSIFKSFNSGEKPVRIHFAYFFDIPEIQRPYRRSCQIFFHYVKRIRIVLLHASAGTQPAPKCFHTTGHGASLKDVLTHTLAVESCFSNKVGKCKLITYISSVK
jgi:hypothetical protein